MWEFIDKQCQWAGSMEGGLCQELFMEPILWRESKDTQTPRLIARDDPEELASLLRLADTVLGTVSRKWTVLYKRGQRGVIITRDLGYASAVCDQAKLDVDCLSEVGTIYANA